MIANQKELYDLVDSVFKPYGYVKKGDTWYLHTPECICFFSLGKSPFAGRYENLMGCFVKNVYKGESRFPKFYEKNLSYLIEQFIGDDKTRVIFDLENKEFTSDKRELEIRKILLDYVLPFLNDVSSEKGILNAILKYKDLEYQIDTELSEYIEKIKK